ncbi:hypothetical protein [Kribbella antiqua]|uniref:hypothetical protein n=1 Tax=Kribbella antiqua TaxID=2512217 RepID=UPI001F547CA1|nr:hypothetical protein [Kribbella antiqua]
MPDLEALERYIHDPVHIAGDEQILDKIEKLSAVRFTDADDPDLGKAVYDLHVGKTQVYPEWGRRIEELFGADV